MRLLLACISGVGFLVGQQSVALAQERATEVERIKKEIDLLKREIDLLKRENELLKKENAALKKGGTTKTADTETDAALRVTVDKVEYVYQGLMRSGANVFATVLATSTKGDRPGPSGRMFLVDDDGEKYEGTPVLGTGTPAALREGVPLKITWRFGPSPLTGKSSAPSPMIKRFPIATIESQFGVTNDTIDFRNAPAVVSKAKSKAK